MIVFPSGAKRALWIGPRRKVSRWKRGWGSGPALQISRPPERPIARAARRAAAARREGSRAWTRAFDGSRPGRREARQRLELEGDVVRGVEALLGVLLEAVADDPLEAGRDVLVGDGELRRILLQDRRHRVRGRVAVEGALAREHLVEDRAEGEDVRARVGGLAAHLLGRHVAERAHDDAGLRARGRGREVRRLAALLRVRQLGEAEVEDLHAAVVGHEDVLGLQVPVDDALLVRGREAVGDLERVVDGLALREGAAREDRPQRLAFEQLQDDVGRVRRGSRCRGRRGCWGG